MNQRAAAYAARRKTPPMTPEEIAAVTVELDPTGEIGDGIIDRQLQMLGRIEKMMKGGFRPEKIKAECRREMKAFGEFLERTGREAWENYQRRKHAGDVS